MKKYEKALLAIFGFCAVLSISAVLYIWYGLEKGLGYIDDGITVVPYWCTFVSLAGLSAVLVSWRLRKRAEAGKNSEKNSGQRSYYTGYWLRYC